MVFAVVVAALVGIAIGAGGAAWWLRSSRREPAPPPAAAVAPEPPVDVVTDVAGADGAGPLRDALDHLDVGVVVVDEAGAVRFRNQLARSLDGTHTGVLIDDHVAAIAGVAREGSTARRVVELHGPPKSWYEITADRLPAGGAIATIRDVSERVRTDAVRTDFVTNVSHELKTPVGALAVLAETLADEDEPDVVRRVAERLVDEAHRAVRTIDDLLELSQIESTRPDGGIVDLTTIVQRAMARGRTADAGRGIELHVLDTSGPLLVRGDERQLESAVGNLVENAVKYSHDGGVVQVRTRVDAQAVEIMVADQGIGIPSRDLDRVFERFYRVDKARSRETGGTGLGLAIVRHVATNHGGEVLVSSQEGEGSTFVLRLPATRIVADDDGDPLGPARHPDNSGQETDRERGVQ